MATVELARDEQLGRLVAIKRLSPTLMGDEVFRERFLREARVAAGLSHPNIVAVYDVGEEDGVPYIVMEYVEGQTLGDLITERAPLDPDRAVDLVLQICAGLEHAHAAGLVHRDIKPQNLLVRSDDTVKIADFGIARPLDGTQLTQAGTVLGTAAYLSPEQALGERVTAAADLYSVGAVAYELLAARPPYEFDSLVDLAEKQRRPPARIPGVGPELEAVLHRCLAADPAARPPSAAALAHELAQVSAEPPTEPLPSPQVTAATEVLASTTARPRIHVSARSQLAAFAVLGVIALGAGLAYGLSRGGDEAAPPPPAQPASIETVPRGQTPAESARLLADWLRDRAG